MQNAKRKSDQNYFVDFSLFQQITVAVSMIEFYKEYSLHAQDENAAKQFLTNIVDYLKSRHFNGLDLNLGDLKHR